MPQKYPKEFLDLCKTVTAKRPKTVIDHILKHGHITTEELKEKYGYNHPPRAVRDAREHGIPLETFRVTGSDGRKIAAYRFGDVSKKRFRKLSGRTGLTRLVVTVKASNKIQMISCCFPVLQIVQSLGHANTAKIGRH